MRTKITLFALFFCLQHSLAAQDIPEKSALSPCGSVAPIDAWLAEYLAHPEDFPEGDNDTLLVGIQIHNIARDNGLSRFAASKVLDAFCRLNTDFKPARIRFYFKNDWNLIDSTKWFNHTAIQQGIEMMLKNNKPDVLNAYFVSNPAGNCGYNLPYAGVAVAQSCAGADDHTWSHEVGHALKLPHPFIGWEGKTYSFGTPTPTRVTYDYTHFHDTLDTVLGRLDTAIVELVDASNCTMAADRVCDTPPDYLSSRWTCDAQGKSPTKQKDPNGIEFYSDGSLYMSYANDACQNRFSPQQIEIMRTVLQTKRSNWLTKDTPALPPMGTASAVAPSENEILPANQVKLVWNKVPNATHYIVQISRFTSFSSIEREVMLKDTSVLISPQLGLNASYNWRVRAFNAWNACTPYSSGYKFKTAPLMSARDQATRDFRYYPTQLTHTRNLTVELPETWVGQPLSFQIISTAGQVLYTHETELRQSAQQIAMPPGGLPAGTYFFTLSNKLGIKTGRIFF